MDCQRSLFYVLLVYLFDGLFAQTKEDVDYRFSQDCFFENQRIKNGNSFNSKSSGPCIKYKCQNRAIFAEDLKCQYGSECVGIGTNITTNPCIKQQCQKSKQSIGFNIVEEGCSFLSNQCIGVGSLYEHECITYKCNKQNGLYSLDVASKGCKYGSSCIQLGQTAIEHCIQKRCDEKNGLVGMYTVESGCAFVNGSCLKADEYAIDKCRLYQCKAELVNGEVWFTAKEKAAMCQDHDGECHGAGAKMGITRMDGIRLNCTCVVNGLTVGYTC